MTDSEQRERCGGTGMLDADTVCDRCKGTGDSTYVEPDYPPGSDFDFDDSDDDDEDEERDDDDEDDSDDN